MKKALVLSLAVVLGLGVASFAQTLSGEWLTTISITPAPTVILAIDTDLTVTYEVSGWSFTSETVIDSSGWTDQSFEVVGSLGAFTIGSTLLFNPDVPSFTSWEVTGGLSLAGVTFGGTFTLIPNDTTLEIVAGGTAGAVDVGVTATFGTPNNGLCDFNWTGVIINVDFPFCCADVMSEISFGCAGFNYVSFEIDGIALPGITWATLDAVLTFTTQTKSLVITPNFDFGGTACFDIYLSDPSDNLLFGDISIDGIGLECKIGGVSFTGISYWGAGAKPGLLTDTVYWEAYQIATDDDGCCGPFAFDVTVYFLGNGTQPGVGVGNLLFDVAALDANFSIQISTQFKFLMGISLDLEAAFPFSAWTLGFDVVW
jgi:hypothetical protein